MYTVRLASDITPGEGSTGACTGTFGGEGKHGVRRGGGLDGCEKSRFRGCREVGLGTTQAPGAKKAQSQAQDSDGDSEVV